MPRAGAKADGTLSKGLVRQFFIGIHSGNNLENIRVDLEAAGYDILYAEVRLFHMHLLTNNCNRPGMNYCSSK
jgi:hypothetical protein